MNILVTGGAGFIGSHLVEKLLQNGHQVDCLDNFNDYYSPTVKHQNLQKAQQYPHFRLIEGDILDLASLRELFSARRYQMIVHLAARAGVRPSIQEPLLYERVNVQGTMHMLELCKEYKVSRLVVASSSSVYGNNKQVPFRETDAVDFPVSPYAATKKATELICHTYHHLYGLSITCLRFFTVYGPRQRPDMAIHKFAQLIDQGRSIPVFGDGHSQRDYTYIDDIIQGVMASIDRCQGYHIYNLGESRTTALLDLIGLLEKSMHKKAKVTFLPMQPGDVPITFADISRAQNELDYHPQTDIEEGIEKFVKWFHDHKVSRKEIG